jgi:hypothetical protein
MKKEEVNNKTIELYIQKIVASYGIYSTVNETALHIQFEHGLYAECVFEIMGKMGLKNKIKLTCYADYKYPCYKSVARIILPQSLPLIGTQRFNSLQIDVEMRESIKKQFYSFISSIAHELSHLVMYGTKHELHKSEIATDLCMLVFGFSDFVVKGKQMTIWTVLGNKNVTLGYLSTSQLHYAINYIQQLQLSQAKNK